MNILKMDNKAPFGGKIDLNLVRCHFLKVLKDFNSKSKGMKIYAVSQLLRLQSHTKKIMCSIQCCNLEEIIGDLFLEHSAENGNGSYESKILLLNKIGF